MSSELSSGSNPTSPSLTGKKRGVEGPAPKAQPEDTSDVQFPEDGMPLNPGEQTVQFIPGQDPSNGDAKVEIGETGGQPKFVGLGKEELMKFANDPFWVRLRWILFILFWLIWLAMLAGAVVIILYAPKCADKLIGPSAGPYYHIDVSKFGGNLDGISDKTIQYLDEMGIKAVVISPVQPKDDPSTLGVVDFVDVDENLGGLEKFTALLSRLADKGIKVILQFIPNHTSRYHTWFKQRDTQEKYYVTKDANTNSTWASQLSLDEPGSAWSESPWSENVTFLHQFSSNEPDLNYKESEVIKEINKALRFWYEKGVDGFLLSDVSFLRENMEKLDDQKATINQNSNHIVVKKLLETNGWNLTINGTERQPPFGLVEVTKLDPDDTKEFYGDNTAVISNSLADLNKTFTAAELKKAVEDTIASTPRNPVHWRLGSLTSRPAQKFGQERTQALTLIAALLRGQLLLSYGDESGVLSGGNFQQPDPNTASVTFIGKVLNATKQLNQTGLGGGTSEYLTLEEKPGVFVMKRANENEFIVAANFGAETASVALDSFKGENEAKLIVATPNAGALKDLSKSVNTIELPANSAVAFKVVKE